MRTTSVVLVLLFAFVTAGAQEPAAPTPPTTITPATTISTPPPSTEAVAPAAKPATVVLREGTPVQLKFAQALSSKTAAEEDPVIFTVAEDVVVDGVVVTKAGTFATGTVSHARRAGMMGKPGELNVRLSHMKCAEHKIKLRGSKGKEGEGKEGTAVALTTERVQEVLKKQSSST